MRTTSTLLLSIFLHFQGLIPVGAGNGRALQALEELASEGHIGRWATQWGAEQAQQSDDMQDGVFQSLASSGGVAPLIALVRDGTESQKEQAIRALYSLTADEQRKMQSSIVNCGGIPPLMTIIRQSSAARQSKLAAATLCNLAFDGDDRKLLALTRLVAPIVALARDGAVDQKQLAANALKTLADAEHNRAAIAEAGGVVVLRALAEELTEEMAGVAKEALWALALNSKWESRWRSAGRAAVGGGLEAEQPAAMLCDSFRPLNAEERVGAALVESVAPLVSAIRHGSMVDTESAILALHLLAEDADHRRVIKSAGAVEPLLSLARDGTVAQRRGAAAVLRTLEVDYLAVGTEASMWGAFLAVAVSLVAVCALVKVALAQNLMRCHQPRPVQLLGVHIFSGHSQKPQS